MLSPAARPKATRRDPAPATGRRETAIRLGTTLAAAAMSGGLAGLVIGGVLGRLAMRLLAVTSPAGAQGRVTDDLAIVGRISLTGTLGLALFTTLVGVIGGLVYVWVRRVLPTSRAGRVLLFGVFTGSIGGALFVHDYPSFDYTVLAPAWLAIVLFVALPLTYGLVVSLLVEVLDAPTGLLRRAPKSVVLGAGAVVMLPTLPFTGPVILTAFAVALVPRLRRMWFSDLVTLAGSALFALLVLWGLYGLGVDIESIATNRPSTAPFNP